MRSLCAVCDNTTGINHFQLTGLFELSKVVKKCLVHFMYQIAYSQEHFPSIVYAKFEKNSEFWTKLLEKREYLVEGFWSNNFQTI